MTNRQIPFARKLAQTIRRNRCYIDAIDKDEVMLYVCVNNKPKNIGCELNETQYRIVENLIKTFLRQNIKDAEVEELKLWKNNS